MNDQTNKPGKHSLLDKVALLTGKPLPSDMGDEYRDGHHRNPSNARFCDICGEKTLYFYSDLNISIKIYNVRISFTKHRTLRSNIKSNYSRTRKRLKICSFSIPSNELFNKRYQFSLYPLYFYRWHFYTEKSPFSGASQGILNFYKP